MREADALISATDSSIPVEHASMLARLLGHRSGSRGCHRYALCTKTIRLSSVRTLCKLPGESCSTPKRVVYGNVGLFQRSSSASETSSKSSCVWSESTIHSTLDESAKRSPRGCVVVVYAGRCEKRSVKSDSPVCPACSTRNMPLMSRYASGLPSSALVMASSTSIRPPRPAGLPQTSMAFSPCPIRRHNPGLMPSQPQDHRSQRNPTPLAGGVADLAAVVVL